MIRIKRKSLAEEVFEILKENIEQGNYARDEKLPTEPELMDKFAVGRSTIREAIKYLSQSGYVRVQQGLGTFVSSPKGNAILEHTIKAADFAEIAEVRKMLETKVVEKAAMNRKKKHLDSMTSRLKERAKFAEEGNIKACIEADILFHTVVAESCGNTLLFEMYKTLSDHIGKFFVEVYKDTQSFVNTQKIHEELVEHIKNKDTKLAVKTAKIIIGTI